MEDGRAAVKGLWTLEKGAFALGLKPEALSVLIKDLGKDMGVGLTSGDGQAYLNPDRLDAWLEDCHTRICVLREREEYIWMLAAESKQGLKKGVKPTLVN